MRRAGRSAGVTGVMLVVLLLCGGLMPGAADAAPRKAWTVMVYLDGDNDLDAWGWYNLGQMARGMSSDRDLSIVVLYDHYGADGAETYLVTPGGYRKLADVAEPDMGSPETLRRFITWAVRAYPAEKYVLDLWNHGRGWAYFASDDTSGSRMMIGDLQTAIAGAEAETGEWMDLTVFDGCSMALIELSYELRGLTGVLAASQQVVPLEGLPYEPIVASLCARPGQSASVLGRVIVDSYVTFFLDEVRGTSNTATFAAIDESAQVNLAAAYDRLAARLLAGMDRWKAQVGASANVAEHQVWGWGLNGSLRFIDSWVFADQLAARISDPAVVRDARALQTALTAAVYERHSPQQEGRSHGLSVSFPPSKPQYDFVNWFRWDYAGIGLDFPADTRWDEMLLAYYAASGGK